MAASRAVRISLPCSLRSFSARLWCPSSTTPLGMILHATWRVGGLMLAWLLRWVVSRRDCHAYLLVAVLLFCQLDLAHAPGADCLAQDPFPRLRRYRGPRPGLWLARRARVGGGGDGSRAGVVCNGGSHGCCRARLWGVREDGSWLARG